jgi:hypothetical protein
MIGPIRVQLSRRKGWRMPENTVKVSRPSKWGNPFLVTPEQDRATAVELYRLWMTGWYGSTLLPATPSVVELRGKNLACWCPLDQPCHADVLLALANVPEVSE